MDNPESKSIFIPIKQHPLSLRRNRDFISTAAVLAILCLMVSMGGQLSINFLGVLSISVILTAIAYRFPYITIALVFLLGQIMGQEAQLLLPENLRQLELGPLKLRYFDPMLLGIIFAVVLKLLQRDKILMQFLFRNYLLWTLLLGWLSIEIMRSLGVYSIINILGEFRTYYQYLLLIPYIVIFFQTEDEQWRLFKLLIVLSLLFILSGLIRGGILRGFEIGFGVRWFSASANLALLNGMIALYFGIRHRLIKINSTVIIMLFTAFFVMTIINNIRSVWLATAAAILIVMLLRQSSLRMQILSTIGILTSLVITHYLMTIYSIDFLTFIQDRSKAFYDYKSDVTASWRYYLWIEALSRIKESPFLGQGLGLHFELYLNSGEVVYTSPHNLYITIPYQLGFTGLLLYAGLLAQIFYRFRKAASNQVSKQKRTMILAASIILFSSSAYYIAYVFEYFTWLYVGVAIAVNNDKVKK